MSSDVKRSQDQAGDCEPMNVEKQERLCIREDFAVVNIFWLHHKETGDRLCILIYNIYTNIY